MTKYRFSTAQRPNAANMHETPISPATLTWKGGIKRWTVPGLETAAVRCDHFSRTQRPRPATLDVAEARPAFACRCHACDENERPLLWQTFPSFYACFRHYSFLVSSDSALTACLRFHVELPTPFQRSESDMAANSALRQGSQPDPRSPTTPVWSTESHITSQFHLVNPRPASDFAAR